MAHQEVVKTVNIIIKRKDSMNILANGFSFYENKDPYANWLYGYTLVRGILIFFGGKNWHSIIEQAFFWLEQKASFKMSNKPGDGGAVL